MPTNLPTNSSQLDTSVIKVMKAIKSIESGGDYNAVGDGGESHGAYQWNKDNFKNQASQFGLDPNDMSPANQNKVAYARIKSLKDEGHSPDEVAAIWNGAKKDPTSGELTYINPEYGQKFHAALQEMQKNQPQGDTQRVVSPPIFASPLQEAAPPTQTNNTFSTPLTNIASGNSEANTQGALGAAKGVGGLLLDVGGADKNPFVKDMVASAGPALQQGVASARQAVQPTNLEQEKGAQQSYLAANLLGPSEGTSAIQDSGLLATKRLASTAESMTAKELKQQAGRVLPSGKVVPAATEQRAGQLLKGKTSSNPVKTLLAIRDEITSRGQGAETYLEQNAVPITNKEDFSAFNSIKNSSEKYMTSAEAKAYEEQVGVFQKILKGYGKYDTSNYYKALKEYESQVTANLPKGKDALLVPGGSARIQAAKDVRAVVRDMIGKKNPEFKGKMFDLASLYDVEDNILGQVASKAKESATFGQRHPFVKKGLIGAAELAGGITGYNLLKDKLPPGLLP